MDLSCERRPFCSERQWQPRVALSIVCAASTCQYVHVTQNIFAVPQVTTRKYICCEPLPSLCKSVRIHGSVIILLCWQQYISGSNSAKSRLPYASQGIFDVSATFYFRVAIGQTRKRVQISSVYCSQHKKCRAISPPHKLSCYLRRMDNILVRGGGGSAPGPCLCYLAKSTQCHCFIHCMTPLRSHTLWRPFRCYHQKNWCPHACYTFILLFIFYHKMILWLNVAACASRQCGLSSG